MASDFEQAIFEEELHEVRSLPEANRWILERDNSVPLGVYAVMHPASNPNELYRARLRWGNYFGPVSLKFINIKNGSETDSSAWPRCHGFRPASRDVCLPWTAEGHALHPEWANSVRNAFPKPESPLQFSLLHLQFALDNTYSGRGC